MSCRAFRLYTSSIITDNFVCQLERGKQKWAVVWEAGIQRGVWEKGYTSPCSVLHFLYLRGDCIGGVGRWMSDMKHMHAYVRCFDEAAECDDS